MSNSTSNATVGIFEFNDQQLTLAVGDQYWYSAGYAMVGDKTVLFGDAARQQARLQPLACFNQYWNDLSTDPIRTNNHKVSSYADLVYWQILALVEQASPFHQALLCVPANFDRNQLAILLGICEQCPFTVVGIVDNALCAISRQKTGHSSFLLDIQLHQCLLTEFSGQDQRQVLATQIITGAGMVQLQQRWAKYINAQFIQQCRFDPSHDGHSEQQLYDLLSTLTNDIDRDLPLTIGNHSIKLSRQAMAAQCQSVFEQVITTVAETTAQSDLLVTARVAAIPELFTALGSPIVVDQNSGVIGGYHYQNQIRCTPERIEFCASLTTDTQQAQAGEDLHTARPSTHLLWRHAAYPLSASPIYISSKPQIQLSAKQTSDTQFALRYSSDDQDYMPYSAPLTLTVLNGSMIEVNGKAGRQGDILNCGDTLSFNHLNEVLTLISVVEEALTNGP